MLTPIPYSERPLPIGIPGVQADEAGLRSLICHIGRLMYDGRYVDAASGNISVRLDENRILATPSGLAKGFLQPDQLIIVDMDGNKIGPETEANRNLRPTSELLMHLECYKQRPDVNGVVHAHPPTAVALTLAGISMRTCVIPEAIVVLGLVPTAAYCAPAGVENRNAIRALIGQHDAIMLAHHGSLTVGTDVWQAYMHLETLEHTAIILHRAAQIGPIPTLPPEEVAKLLEMRRQLGYWRHGDEERFCEACGVC